jgi:hypothetical protein
MPCSEHEGLSSVEPQAAEQFGELGGLWGPEGKPLHHVDGAFAGPSIECALSG